MMSKYTLLGIFMHEKSNKLCIIPKSTDFTGKWIA